MKTPVIVGFLLLFSLLFFLHQVCADDQVMLTPEKLHAFADSLLDEGENYRAITEYKRFIFLFPDHNDVKYIRYRIGQAYFNGEEWDKAAGEFMKVSHLYKGSKVGIKALYMIGECYYRKGDYGKARTDFESFLSTYPESPYSEKAIFMTGWCSVQERNWNQAIKDFGRVDSESEFAGSARFLKEELSQVDTLPEKSPALAGTLSALLPGSGQYYTGRYKDGTVAFLLNSAFIWGAVESFREGNEAVGGILVFFELGWYFGNIYSAVNSAHKFNERYKRLFIDGLKRKHGMIQDVSERDKRDIIIGFNVRF